MGRLKFKQMVITFSFLLFILAVVKITQYNIMIRRLKGSGNGGRISGGGNKIGNSDRMTFNMNNQNHVQVNLDKARDVQLNINRDNHIMLNLGKQGNGDNKNGNGDEREPKHEIIQAVLNRRKVKRREKLDQLEQQMQDHQRDQNADVGEKAGGSNGTSGQDNNAYLDNKLDNVIKKQLEFQYQNCSVLMQYDPKWEYSKENLGDNEKEIINTVNQATGWRRPVTYSNEDMVYITSDCQRLHRHFPFPKQPKSKVEHQFPLAFAMMLHKSSEQVMRLLQAVYWPQNTYCMHIDRDASWNFKEAIRNMVKCFDNIWVSDRSLSVFWGHISVLEGAMICMDELRKNKRDWKYVTILAGVDFPLKTNREMVEILKIFNGANDIDLMWPDKVRYIYRYPVVNGSDPRVKEAQNKKQYHKIHWLKSETYMLMDKKNLKELPPHEIHVYKGSYQATMTREFINFIFENQIAIDYYAWLQDILVPDENFWSTMIHNPNTKAPGTFPGRCLASYEERDITKKYISRYQVWDPQSDQHDKSTQCGGKMRNWSCIYGVKDLSTLIKRRELFAHKLSLKYQPAVLSCLYQWHHDKIRRQEDKDLDDFDRDFYQNMASVKYHQMSEEEKRHFNCSIN